MADAFGDSLKFDDRGLIPAIAQDAATGEVLMVAWMNREALERSLATGEAHYWSRSRGELWHKGGSSGHVQRIVEMRTDCDSDTLLVRVEQAGGACHEGYRSCFFRRRASDGSVETDGERVFDPKDVYKV